MVYKVYKSNNYIIIIDENDNYFEEHCANVLVTKLLTPSTTYDITFFRTESVPQAFYSIPFANIRQQSGAPYANVATWESWYTLNTGLCSNAAVLNSILATLQAQTDVEGVFVIDTGNFDKIVLQVKVWDQDSQSYIAIYYYNPDGTLYTPVGPLEWVGPGGSVNATIISPLGNTTTCGNAVAVTYCAAQATEFFDQGTTLDDILTELTTGTLDVNITNLNIAVTATDLDIRDLVCATDSVSICSDGVIVASASPLPVGLYADDLVSLAPERLTTTGGPTYQALDVNQVPFVRTPNLKVYITGTGFIAVPVYSITFFNSGSDNEQITFDGGTSYETIPPGVSISMDAGGNNTYPASAFGYDVLGSGPLIITYNS